MTTSPERHGDGRSPQRLAWASVGLLFLVPLLAFSDQRQALAGGVGTGSFYAALALAVVLTYRATGVVNFSVGATAMYAGYVYNDVRENGSLFLPPLPNPLSLVEGALHRLGAEDVRLPDLPTAVSFGQPQGAAVSFGVALFASALLGAAVHFLVFRPLRNAPPLSKVVASVGLTLLLQAIVSLRFTSTSQSVAPILADRRIRVAGMSMSTAQLVVAGIVVLLTVAFWAAFRFTRTGLAIRGSAENEGAAIILGYSPDVLAGVSWVVSTAVAGTLGVLLASINGSLDPDVMPLLIVPALAAALFGRFTSFGVAVASGFALAMAQAWIQLLGTKTWFPHVSGRPLPGLIEAVPLLVIVVVLAIRGRSIPGRDMFAPGRLPMAPPGLRNPKVPLALAAGASVALLIIGPTWRIAAANSIMGAIICLSLVIVTGFAGQVSLGQIAFAGVSGFSLAKVAAQIGVPMPLGLLLGAVSAAVVGVLFSLPALRIRGVQLAVVSLAAAVAIERFVFSNEVWAGQQGGAIVPPPRLFGVRLGPNDSYGFGDGKVPNPLFGIACLVVLLLMVFLVNNVRRSRLGSHMLAVRSNERAAAAMGVDPARTKIIAFLLGALVAGVGGALQGYGSGVVTPEQFGASASIAILAFAYLGGITSIGGAIIGGLAMPGGILSAVTRQVLGAESDYLLILGGFAVIANTVKAPEGIAGLLRNLPRRTSGSARPPSEPSVASGSDHERDLVRASVESSRCPAQPTRSA